MTMNLREGSLHYSCFQPVQVLGLWTGRKEGAGLSLRSPYTREVSKFRNDARWGRGKDGRKGMWCSEPITQEMWWHLISKWYEASVEEENNELLLQAFFFDGWVVFIKFYEQETAAECWSLWFLSSASIVFNFIFELWWQALPATLLGVKHNKTPRAAFQNHRRPEGRPGVADLLKNHHGTNQIPPPPREKDSSFRNQGSLQCFLYRHSRKCAQHVESL